MFTGMPAVFTGMLLGEELSQAYASGDVFVMPSESETLGLVVLEAMSAPSIGRAWFRAWRSASTIGRRHRVTTVSARRARSGGAAVPWRGRLAVGVRGGYRGLG